MSGEFTIPGFVQHLAVIAVEVVHAEREAIDKALEIVQTEARDSLGTYQPQSGPFAAWAPLAEATKEDRVRQGFPEDEPEKRTGALGESIERTVFPSGREGETGSDSPVMEWQELGTSKMPPRSIMGGAAARKADEVAEVIGGRVYAALVGSSVAGRLIRII